MADPSMNATSAVRFLVGDPNEGIGVDPLLNDFEILFALDQAAQAVYPAAAICARALAARFARQVDTDFETIGSKFSQLRDNYAQLARNLEKEAKRQGGLGVPVVGGISKADDAAAGADTDRVKPFFFTNLFNNPPAPNE